MTPVNKNTYFSSFLPFNKTTDTLAAPIPSIINADFISNLPEGLQMVFSSGISTGTIVALVLNIVLKDDKNNEIENIKDLECEGA